MQEGCRWFAGVFFFLRSVTEVSLNFECATRRSLYCQNRLRSRLLASRQRGQQNHQCRNPQSHPDQEVFAACHLSSIHGEPLSKMLLPARDSATVRPSSSVSLLSVAYRCGRRAVVCQKISVCVLAHTALKLEPTPFDNLPRAFIALETFMLLRDLPALHAAWRTGSSW